MESDPNIRFNLQHGMWTTGVNTPFELIQDSKNYTIKDIVQNIKCPTLVLEAEKDDSFPDQPKITSCLQNKKALRSTANVVLQLYLTRAYLTG
jgi:hypothetical protein